MAKQKATRPIKFSLCFPTADIKHWVSQYEMNTNANDERKLMTELSPRVQKRGYYDLDDFLTACRWKSSRPERYYVQNADGDIRKVTGLALATTDERLKIHLLTALCGVNFPVASVLLHFAMPDRYPIIDFRAFESLSAARVNCYTFDIWDDYTKFCRKLAAQNKVTMRDLDRALWQYSKGAGDE